MFIDMLHWYYELLRLPVIPFGFLGFVSLVPPYCFTQRLQALPGTLDILCKLALLSDPGKVSPVSPSGFDFSLRIPVHGGDIGRLVLVACCTPENIGPCITG
jgi:hypothetical protein